MKIRKYFTAIAVIMTMTTTICSCEKELDFEYRDIEPIPVIESCLTQSEARVAISWATPMDEPFTDSYITNAAVSLTDLATEESFSLAPDEKGVFYFEISGVPGHDYRITIKTSGKTYSSKSTMLSPVEIHALQFYWIKMPGDDMAALQIRFSDNPSTPDYYWVRLYRNGAAYAWSVIADRAAVDGMVEEVITTTHRDESQEDEKQLLRDGDMVTAVVTPVSRQMFDYFNAIMNSSNGEQQYEGGKCLGYFLASPCASATIIYHPDEIDYAQ